MNLWNPFKNKSIVNVIWAYWKEHYDLEYE